MMSACHISSISDIVVLIYGEGTGNYCVYMLFPTMSSSYNEHIQLTSKHLQTISPIPKSTQLTISYCGSLHSLVVV